MEPGNINTDAMSAITEALKRRGMGDKVPALNQQSMGSPTASPLPAEPQGGMSSPSLPTNAAAGSLGGQTGISTGNPEAKMIVGALKERLKAISVVEGGVPQKLGNLS